MQGYFKGRTFSAPRKSMRGKGRVTIQFGCCYNYAVDKEGRPPGQRPVSAPPQPHPLNLLRPAMHTLQRMAVALERSVVKFHRELGTQALGTQCMLAASSGIESGRGCGVADRVYLVLQASFQRRWWSPCQTCWWPW